MYTVTTLLEALRRLRVPRRVATCHRVLRTSTCAPCPCAQAGPREFDNLVSEHLLPPDQQREREREVLPGPRRAVSLGPGAGAVAGLGLGQGAGPVWRPPPRGNRARGAAGRAGPRQGSGHEELLLGEWDAGRSRRFGPVQEEEEQQHEEAQGMGQQQQQAGHGRSSGGGAAEEGNRGGGGGDGDEEDEGRGVQVPYDCSGWRLVVTGHSLGAGAAALLALLLRPSYPNVQCWAFSPPGEAAWAGGTPTAARCACVRLAAPMPSCLLLAKLCTNDGQLHTPNDPTAGCMLCCLVLLHPSLAISTATILQPANTAPSL